MGHSCAVLALALSLAACASSAGDAASPTPSDQRPDPAITPGLVLTTRAADVCTPGWATAHRRSLTAAQERRTLAAYGLPSGTHVAEWDHLVSLELGGGNGPANIWPEVDAAGKARKDRLENALHREVCAGTLPLTEAQTRVRVYWLWWG